jgi:crossover junction endodeoxyribonuclease RuvC
VRVLGIDPGTRVVGYGVVDQRGNRLAHVAHGTISPGGKPSVPDRLRSIYEGILAQIDEHRPDVVSLEKAFYGKSATSSMRIGEGRAVAMLAAAMRDLPLEEYPPAVVKKALVGSGRADKRQVAEMVRRLLSLPEAPASEDASDALAIAICYCHRTNVPQLGGRS